MSDRFEIRIAGTGGQGVILACVIIGQAAALVEEGLNSVQTQAYGPEARGGASKSEVVIARGPIDYPKAATPDLMCVMSQKACDEYGHDLKAGGTMIVDDFFVTNVPKVEGDIYSVPIVRTARDVIGKEIVTNMVALGAISVVLEKKGMMKRESIKKTILASVPKGTEELNERAFEEGVKLLDGKLK